MRTSKKMKKNLTRLQNRTGFILFSAICLLLLTCFTGGFLILDSLQTPSQYENSLQPCRVQIIDTTDRVTKNLSDSKTSDKFDDLIQDLEKETTQMDVKIKETKLPYTQKDLKSKNEEFVIVTREIIDLAIQYNDALNSNSKIEIESIIETYNNKVNQQNDLHQFINEQSSKRTDFPSQLFY